MKDLCVQTLTVIERNFITPVSQVVVWGKFGQCLNNLKTNFRALSMMIIICPLTSLTSGVCAILLSTSLVFLTLCPSECKRAESVQIASRPLLQPSQVMSLFRQAPSLLLSCRGRRLKINPPKSTFRWAFLRTVLKSVHPAAFVFMLCCWCCCFEHRFNYKAFQKIPKRIHYSQKDLLGSYQSCWNLVMRLDQKWDLDWFILIFK